ncbi:hypothetical protein NL676_023144 [Syzygium grande]|nr:hypothetical protein NL676_023144 [Syzygium grande]
MNITTHRSNQGADGSNPIEHRPFSDDPDDRASSTARDPPLKFQDLETTTPWIEKFSSQKDKNKENLRTLQGEERMIELKRERASGGSLSRGRRRRVVFVFVFGFGMEVAPSLRGSRGRGVGLINAWLVGEATADGARLFSYSPVYPPNRRFVTGHFLPMKCCVLNSPV